jgi:hypothetical protein
LVRSSPSPSPSAHRPSVTRNIAISHVTIYGAKKKVIDIHGLPEMPITALRLTDVIGSGQTGLTARYTDALELQHVHLNAERKPVFNIESATDLELDGVNTKDLLLTKSPGAIVRR